MLGFLFPLMPIPVILHESSDLSQSHVKEQADTHARSTERASHDTPGFDATRSSRDVMMGLPSYAKDKRTPLGFLGVDNRYRLVPYA